ncbi:MAG: HsdR family type I site-specific deoxyribonuclease, partial [Leptotrichiaceae bacterium]
MASFLNENALEKEVIERLISKGYEHINGLETVEKNFRSNQNEVVFSEVLYSAMVKLNKSIPTSVIKDAVKKIVNPESTSIINENIRFHKYLSDGITMTYRQGNEDITSRLLIIDFNKFSNNIFHVVDQLTISGSRFSRRPDVIIYINGLPVVVIELKNMTDEKATIETAYNQLETYKNDIPQLFYFNGINVISDGISTRVGTLTSTFDRYLTWKLVDIYEKLPNNASYQIEVLINGLLNPSMLVDYITQYATFPDDKKIMPAYHQYRAIKLGVEHVLTAKDGRGGVVWHTQGSGKSYTMTFFAAKLIQQEKLENPTIIVVTDRNDLDEQLFATFSKSIDILRQTPKQIEDKKELREALNTKGGGIYFTTMQKFTIIGNEERMPLLTDRSNVIIIADEAHRTQYGLDAKYSKEADAYQFGYAKHIRDAFPNAVFVGFTGTPVDTIDRSTPAVFGDYIDQYPMTDS